MCACTCVRVHAVGGGTKRVLPGKHNGDTQDPPRIATVMTAKASLALCLGVRISICPHLSCVLHLGSCVAREHDARCSLF